jgi:hypothetical protein
MRWQPLAVFLPIGLAINAAVYYVGWLIWAHSF